MENKSIWLYLGIVIVLIVGFGGGFYYGNSKGRADLLVEQKSAVEKAQTEAQQEIVQATNPFEATNVNPLKGGYQNPFDTGSNPFTQ